jgi:hypothetical protein
LLGVQELVPEGIAADASWKDPVLSAMVEEAPLPSTAFGQAVAPESTPSGLDEVGWGLAFLGTGTVSATTGTRILYMATK